MSYFFTVILLMAIAASCDRENKGEREPTDTLAIKSIIVEPYTGVITLLKPGFHKVISYRTQNPYQTVIAGKEEEMAGLDFLYSFHITNPSQHIIPYFPLHAVASIDRYGKGYEEGHKARLSEKEVIFYRTFCDDRQAKDFRPRIYDSYRRENYMSTE